MNIYSEVQTKSPSESKPSSRLTYRVYGEKGTTMTTNELESLINGIDPKNAEYILADHNITDKFESIGRWESKDPICLSVLNENDNQAERCKRVAEMLRKDLEKLIRQFDGSHLTPTNAKVGDGATVNLFSDRHAGTIIKVTKATITIRQDRAILDPKFKPEWIPGGFAAHCTNQENQSYTYEPDENGSETTIHWSKKFNRYGTPGNVTASKGRHEFYDYNF